MCMGLDYVFMNQGAHRSQKDVSDTLELESQVVVYCLMWDWELKSDLLQK